MGVCVCVCHVCMCVTSSFPMLLQLLLLALLSASVLAVRQSHILVVLNTDAEREAYSQFFQDVQHRGFQLTYTTPNSAPVLVEKEQRYYDHLFLWADQTKRFPDTLNAKALVQFVERGGNILFTAGPQMSENMRTFATQFGVFFEERDTQVIDHFGYDAQLDQGKHTVLTAKQLDDAPRTLRADTTAPILYEGIGHISSRNPMLMRVLSASQTAYSAEERVVDEEPMATGHELGLVSAFQAVNNARVVLSGSRVMFSNR
jgi:oligosaccharyltransferase complex subunit beta